MRRTVCLLAAAGLAATALGQTDHDNENRQQEREQDWRSQPSATQTVLREWHFQKASSLLGAEVQNSAGETTGSIDDLIFEPGTGRITHAVIASGGVAGIGAKEIAVPYSRLRHDNAADAFSLDMTEEQIDAAPDFDPEQWSSLDHNTWMDDVRNVFRTDGDDADTRDEHMDSDRYGERVRGGQSEEIQGTVKSVERKQIGDSDEEQTILTVETDDGKSKKVVLGPSWYINRQEATPYRGERVTLEVYPVDGDEHADCVCGKLKDDSGELTLRDEQGSPAWSSGRQPGSSGRLMLVSDLVGAEALLPADDETGEIQDVVVEVGSGQIVLAALDPNDNFLGVGDDLKGIPWPSVRVVDSDTVRVDATDTMINNAEDLPDDVTVLATPAALEPSYQVFEIEVIEIRPIASAGAGDDAFGQQDRGPVLALQDGEDVTITGEVTSVSTQTVDGFDSEMTVASIETDEGVKTVILGPKQHFDGNPLMLSSGDQVTIEAKRADFNGRELLAACTLDANGRETALWSGGRPIWD